MSATRWALSLVMSALIPGLLNSLDFELHNDMLLPKCWVSSAMVGSSVIVFSVLYRDYRLRGKRTLAYFKFGLT